MLGQDAAQRAHDVALALRVDGAGAVERNALRQQLSRRMGEVDRGIHDVDGITRGWTRSARQADFTAAGIGPR